jgi:hypothetical protein
MKFKTTIALIACVFLLTGCSNEPETKTWGITKTKKALAEATKARDILSGAPTIEGKEKQLEYARWSSLYKVIYLEAYLDLIETGENPGGFPEYYEKRLRSSIKTELGLNGGFESPSVKHAQMALGERPLPLN